MHPVLYLPEILYNIFGHAAPAENWKWIRDRLPYTSDLAALARTCRAFKEPALDVLWSELPELSTLARCVPDAVQYSEFSCSYRFVRPLTEAEWATIRSHSRRVWIFRNVVLEDVSLEPESCVEFLKYTGGALFPNLRKLSWNYRWPFPLMPVVSPQLRALCLNLQTDNVDKFRNVLDSAGTLYPLMKIFRIALPRQYPHFDSAISRHVLCWSNLQTLLCHEVALSADVILHLSRVSALVRLAFVMNEEAVNQIHLSDIELVFQNVSYCKISAGWLQFVTRLLTRARFPSLQEFIVRFPSTPPKQALQSFMSALLNSCSIDTLTKLSIQNQGALTQRLCSYNKDRSVKYPLSHEVLYPCTAFGNLRSLTVNLEQSVELTEDALIDLVSAWPHLGGLFVNNEFGWRASGGITLRGLIRLFRTCPLLHSFALLLDTPTFRTIPEGMDISYPAREMYQVNLIDSPLKRGAISDVTNVFVTIKFSPQSLSAYFPPGLDAMIQALRKPSWHEVGIAVKQRLRRTGSKVKAFEKNKDMSREEMDSMLSELAKAGWGGRSTR